MTSIKDALERIIQIYERNIGRQNEKLADIPLVARRALATLTTPAPGRDEAAIYICYDGHGHYFINKDRPSNHVVVVYDEETAEKVVNLFNAVDGNYAKAAELEGKIKVLESAILSALPVAPVVDEAGIRADEREKCARIAEHDNRTVAAIDCGYEPDWFKYGKRLAQAIRAGGGER